MAIVAPETTEHLGQALGAQLIYSGSFEMSVQMDLYNQIRLQAGIQSLGLIGSWLLGKASKLHRLSWLVIVVWNGLS